MNSFYVKQVKNDYKHTFKQIWYDNPITFYINFMKGLLDSFDKKSDKIFSMIWFACYPVSIVPGFTLLFAVPVFLLNILKLILIPLTSSSIYRKNKNKEYVQKTTAILIYPTVLFVVWLFVVRHQ